MLILLCTEWVTFEFSFHSLVPITLFVVVRTVGKYSGSYWGGSLAEADKKISKHTAGGLIPQGGIVIGLALTIRQNPAFSEFSDLLLTMVMGATVVHEIIGPLMARQALRKAGEIERDL